MARYAMSAVVLGRPVMCDTIEAPDAAQARKNWEDRFWNDADRLRAELPSMDADNVRFAERMIASIERHHADARRYGLTVEARKSRAGCRS